MAYTSAYKNEDGNDVVSASGILSDGWAAESYSS